MNATDQTKTMTESQMLALHEEAHAAGMKAGRESVPEPMIVQDCATGHVYEPVLDGVCGFAWVTIKPGGSRFARFLKRRGFARRDSYEGGVKVWVFHFGQSMTRKAAYAREYAHVVAARGVRAYAGSRMD
jgi:hypothetical protein